MNAVQMLLRGAELSTADTIVLTAADAGIAPDAPRISVTVPVLYGQHTIAESGEQEGRALVGIRLHTTSGKRMWLFGARQRLLESDSGSLEWTGFWVPGKATWSSLRVAVADSSPATLTTEWVQLNDAQIRRYVNMEDGYISTIINGTRITNVGKGHIMDGSHPCRKRHTVRVACTESDTEWEKLRVESRGVLDISQIAIVTAVMKEFGCNVTGWHCDCNESIPDETDSQRYVLVAPHMKNAVKSWILEKWPYFIVSDEGFESHYELPTQEAFENATAANVARYHELVATLGADFVFVH